MVVPVGDLSIETRTANFLKLADSLPRDSLHQAETIYQTIATTVAAEEYETVIEHLARLLPGQNRPTEAAAAYHRAVGFSPSTRGRSERGELFTSLVEAGCDLAQAERSLPLLFLGFGDDRRHQVGVEMVQSGAGQHLAYDLEAFLRYGPEDQERRLSLYLTLLRVKKSEGDSRQASRLYTQLGETVTDPEEFVRLVSQEFRLGETPSEESFFGLDAEQVTLGDHQVVIQD